MSENLLIQQIDPKTRKAVLLGCLPFSHLNKKVRFTFRDYSEDNEPTLYQRRVEMPRVRAISSFIASSLEKKEDSLPLFPTSIILAVNDIDINFQKSPGSIEIVKELEEDIMIVDGQHRFKAMQELYKTFKESFFERDILKKIENYRFNCSILVNYDLWEQAQIFASVNFNQKKVNKSLFYDIYGIHIPDESSTQIPRQNEIYLSHKLISFLNSKKDSPLEGFVKMLGKGSGYVSQAFLVEQFLKHFSSKGIWNDVSIDFQENKKSTLYNYVFYELLDYFTAISEVLKDYWPDTNSNENKARSILTKTTGIGAIIRFLSDLHNNMSDELIRELKENPSSRQTNKKVQEYFKSNLKKISKQGNRLFNMGTEGEFNGSGGKGLETKLYNEIRRIWSNNLIPSI